jgi:hypothetical protein
VFCLFTARPVLSLSSALCCFSVALYTLVSPSRSSKVNNYCLYLARSALHRGVHASTLCILQALAAGTCSGLDLAAFTLLLPTYYHLPSSGTTHFSPDTSCTSSCSHTLALPLSSPQPFRFPRRAVPCSLVHSPPAPLPLLLLPATVPASPWIWTADGFSPRLSSRRNLCEALSSQPDPSTCSFAPDSVDHSSLRTLLHPIGTRSSCSFA